MAGQIFSSCSGLRCARSPLYYSGKDRCVHLCEEVVLGSGAVAAFPLISCVWFWVLRIVFVGVTTPRQRWD